MRTPIAVAAAVAGLMLASQASAGFCANPASNFSAYYYQSPGGVGRARSVRTSGRAAHRARVVRYDRSCAAWLPRGGHCGRD